MKRSQFFLTLGLGLVLSTLLYITRQTSERQIADIFYYAPLFWILILSLIQDFEDMTVPSDIIYAGIGIVVVYTIVKMVFLGSGLPYSLIWGTLSGGGLFAIPVLISRGKWMGAGDIELGVLMGAILGWPLVLLALFLSTTCGAVVGIFLRLTARNQPGQGIPFGPYLSLATIFAIFWGQPVLVWYSHFVN